MPKADEPPSQVLGAPTGQQRTPRPLPDGSDPVGMRRALSVERSWSPSEIWVLGRSGTTVRRGFYVVANDRAAAGALVRRLMPVDAAVPWKDTQLTSAVLLLRGSSLGQSQ